MFVKLLIYLTRDDDDARHVINWKYAIIYDQPVTVNFNLLEEGVLFHGIQIMGIEWLSSKARRR